LDQGTIVNLAQRALMIIIYVSAPMLGLSLIVGLAISIFQATTQIHEQTLTFVPKIIAVITAIAVFGAWMLRVLVEYTEDLYYNINQLIR